MKRTGFAGSSAGRPTQIVRRFLVMSTAGRKLKLGFAVAALAGAITATSAGPAVAALVRSDVVAFKGTFNSAGEYSSTGCKLKSDGEFNSAGKLETFPCVVRGRALGIGGTTIEVESQWASPDGEGAFLPLAATRVKSEPPKETYAGTGPCEEIEETEPPGSGNFVTYTCRVKVKLKFNTATGTVTGTYVVFEESTQP
jgi:hypothetical protein